MDDLDSFKLFYGIVEYKNNYDYDMICFTRDENYLIENIDDKIIECFTEEKSYLKLLIFETEESQPDISSIENIKLSNRCCKIKLRGYKVKIIGNHSLALRTLYSS